MKKTKKQMLNPDETGFKSKFVDNNTLQIEKDGKTFIRLHNTDVVIKDGDIYTLNSGGYKTPTTKDRINNFSPAGIRQNKGVWYVDGSEFYDGIKINQDGKVITPRIGTDNKKLNELKKRIKNFVNLITKDNLPLPSPGDCWMCLIMDREGEDVTHLIEHIKEGYIHGSLIVNALKESHYAHPEYVFRFPEFDQRAVRKYLLKRLLPIYNEIDWNKDE